MSYRDYLPDATGGLFYSVPNASSYMPTTNAPLSAMQVQSGTTPGAAYSQFVGGMPGYSPNMYGGAGGSGNNAAGEGSMSASPSSVTGVGMGSMMGNISQGNNIAAAMGLAGMLGGPAVSVVSAIPGILGMLGISGVANGYAINNARSTNNVAKDVADMVKVIPRVNVNQEEEENNNESAVGVSTEGNTSGVGVTGNVGVGPEGVGATGPSGAEGAAAAAAAAAGASGEGAGATGTTGDSSSSAGTDGGSSGTFSRGGRAYQRFAGGGEVHAFDEVFKPTARRPLRKAYNRDFPGIWEDPRAIAAEANERVAPEDPAMQRLFGYNRDQLYDEFAGRKGNVDGMSLVNLPAKPRGSEAARRLMTPGNAQRLIDTLSEAGKYPDLHKGMDSWYAMDPAHQRLTELVGGDEADRLYRRFNTLSGMASPGSAVSTEINRGTTANGLAEQGRFNDFRRFAGTPGEERGADFPPDMQHVIAHPYHSTAQAGPMGRFLDSDEVNMSKTKVPLYIGASGVPSTGFQTNMPVPDAHFVRGIGLSDTRTDANSHTSIRNPEFADIGPWYRDKVAAPLGLESVPAQARQWGTFGHATGVDTSIGAPKLELLSRHIMNRAHEMGIDPETMRDGLLMGRLFARGGVVDHLPPLR